MLKGEPNAKVNYTMKQTARESYTFLVKDGKYERGSGGICMWGFDVSIDSGPFKGDEIDLKRANHCSNSTITLGTKDDCKGMTGVVKGPKGNLYARIQ